MHTKIRKIVTPVDEPVPVPAGTSLVDEEAVARLDAVKTELALVSERVTKLRSEVIERQKKMSEAEMSTRNNIGIDMPSEENVAADSEEDINNTAAAMKESMSKLGTTLLSLASTMPDKMESLARNIEVCQDEMSGQDSEIDQSMDGETGDMSSMEAENQPEETAEEVDENDEDAEDLFASMIGR